MNEDIYQGKIGQIDIDDNMCTYMLFEEGFVCVVVLTGEDHKRIVKGEGEIEWKWVEYNRDARTVKFLDSGNVYEIVGAGDY